MKHSLQSFLSVLRTFVIPTVMMLSMGLPTILLGQAELMVTNTSDAGAGSLRQAIIDANASLGADDIVFSIPDTDTGFNDTWWTISLASPLPDIVSSGTRILGSTQTANQGDKNAGTVGTGGAVGRAELPLPLFELPEIAINGNGFDGLSISATASDIEIEGIAIYGSRNGIVAKGVLTVGLGAENRRVHGVMVGPMPDGTDPGGFANSGHGIVVEAATSPIDVTVLSVDSSYVGYNSQVGVVSALGSTYLEITACEVFMNGAGTDAHDGIDVNGIGGIVNGNLSWGNTNASGIPNPRSGNGIEAGTQESPGTGSYEITNNTLSGNLSGGIAFRGGASFSLVMHNIVTENAVGIHVNEDGDGTTAHNRFQENSIYANDGLGIDLHVGASDDAFDGVTLNSDTSGMGGANFLVPYPVITEAKVDERVLTIKGFAQPGGIIELFEAAADDSGFGEGIRFIIALTEGSAGVDMDETEGTYGPEVGGVTVSTAELTANRFEFSYGLGDEESDEMVLTATQTLSTSPCLSCPQIMSTSEFGPNIETELVSHVANESNELPTLFKLHEAYPNPFNPSTTISFDLERPGLFTLRLYGADGVELRTLIDQTLTTGFHSVNLDASGLPSGLYFVRAEFAGQSISRSALLLK